MASVKVFIRIAKLTRDIGYCISTDKRKVSGNRCPVITVATKIIEIEQATWGA